VPILSEGSMSLGEGQLARGGLVVNEFACPCTCLVAASVKLTLV